MQSRSTGISHSPVAATSIRRALELAEGTQRPWVAFSLCRLCHLMHRRFSFSWIPIRLFFLLLSGPSVSQSNNPLPNLTWWSSDSKSSEEFPLLCLGLYPFGVIFCLSYKTRVQLHSPAWGSPVFPAPCVEKIACRLLNDLGSTLAENHLTLHMRIDFWALDSSPLICRPAFMLVSYCFESCRFAVSVEIRKCETSDSVLPFASLSWLFPVPNTSSLSLYSVRS